MKGKGEIKWVWWEKKREESYSRAGQPLNVRIGVGLGREGGVYFEKGYYREKGEKRGYGEREGNGDRYPRAGQPQE